MTWTDREPDADLPDGYAYPSDKQLAEVSTFDVSQPNGCRTLFDRVKELWWMPDWGWSEWTDEPDERGQRTVHLHVSTAGWSGNEDLIGAMQSNAMFWLLVFETHMRGGHFHFRYPDGR